MPYKGNQLRINFANKCLNMLTFNCKAHSFTNRETSSEKGASHARSKYFRTSSISAKC